MTKQKVYRLNPQRLQGRSTQFYDEDISGFDQEAEEGRYR
jgi:hypothetical protein